jgi:hypothetical protein
MHAAPDLQQGQGFVRKYLDPASRLGEILFGLIMVLTVTLGAGVALTDYKAGSRRLLLAAIGCNVAWGIIDAVMFLMDCVTVRMGRVRLVRAVRRAPNEQSALRMIQNEVEPELQALLDPQEAEAFNRSILKHMAGAQTTTKALTKDDFYGAVACFWLAFVSCLPAAIPFLIFSKPYLALRVSNFLLLVLLFWVGRKWADYLGVNRLVAGVSMVAVGLVLVGIAILLGC